MDNNYEVNFHKDIIATVRQPLIVLDPGQRVLLANRAYYQHFHCIPEEIEGQLFYNICNKKWDIPELKELLVHILPEKTTFENFEVSAVFDRIGVRTMLLNARKIYRDDNNTNMVLLAIEDITERKNTQEILHEKIDELKMMLNLMAGREARMVGLKKVIKKLRSQLFDEGFSPVANDPLAENLK